MNLIRVTAPSETPVSLAEIKAHAVVDHDDDDVLLTSYLAAAVATIDGPGGIGWCCCTQTWRLTLDGFPRSIVLPLAPVANDAAISITYVDADGEIQTLASDHFRLSGGVVDPAFGECFPTPRRIRGAVTIEFAAGVAAADVAEDLRLAVKMIVADWYANREAAAAKTISGTATDILDRYRVGWFSS